jgi:hypothetical protein
MKRSLKLSVSAVDISLRQIPFCAVHSQSSSSSQLFKCVSTIQPSFIYTYIHIHNTAWSVYNTYITPLVYALLPPSSLALLFLCAVPFIHPYIHQYSVRYAYIDMKILYHLCISVHIVNYLCVTCMYVFLYVYIYIYSVWRSVIFVPPPVIQVMESCLLEMIAKLVIGAS